MSRPALSRSALSRPALALAALSSLALGCFAAAPALASTPETTLQVHMVDTAGNSLANVEVSGANFSDSDFRYVDFGATDANGNLLLTSGGHDGSQRLKTGTYDFEFDDVDRDRYKSDTLFAPTEKDRVVVSAGANDLMDVTLVAGGVATGVARTPSGQPLRGLFYDIESQGQDDQGESFGFGFGGETEFGDGSFEESGLAVGSYDVRYEGARPEDGPPATTFTIAEPGQHVSADFTARVPATPAATTLVASSPSKGQVQLIFKIANTQYGITDPHGTVTVASAAGKAVGQPTAVTTVNGHGKAIVTFAASSTSHVYVLHYGSSDIEGGTSDLLSLSKSVKVTVK